MAKKKKDAAAAENAEIMLTCNGVQTIFRDKEDLDQKIKSGYFDPTNILSGLMKDGYCNYGLEVVAGVNSGKKASFDGKTCLFTNDLNNAFRDLRPHMAYIDDLFKINGVTIMRIEDMQQHELTTRFTINGFQIKGTGINEAVVIIGEKYVEEVGDHVSWKSPKITIGEHSHYKWMDNLNAVIRRCREEVQLYHHGKYTKEVAEVKPEVDPSQTSILDVTEDFTAAKVD